MRFFLTAMSACRLLLMVCWLDGFGQQTGVSRAYNLHFKTSNAIPLFVGGETGKEKQDGDTTQKWGLQHGVSHSRLFFRAKQEAITFSSSKTISSSTRLLSIL